LTVDDLIAAASGLIAVRFLDNLSLAARVRLGVVVLGSTARRVLAVIVVPRVASAADRASGIVSRGTTTLRNPAVGL